MNEFEVVKNKYKQDSDLKLRFLYECEEYHVEMGRYLLSIMNSRGECYYSFEVYHYYDCLTYNKGVLYFGDRSGKIHAISMKERREVLSFFINEEAADFYNSHINLYALTLPHAIRNHLLGDYIYLPETIAMNEIVTTLSISALHMYGKYIIIGDLSGRISLFDTDNMKIVKTIKANGAISFISDDKDSVVIDFIYDKHFDSS